VAEQFGTRIREWIRCHAPSGLAEQAPWWSPAGEGSEDEERCRAAADSAPYREWERLLADAKLICPAWPERYGGAGLNPAQLLTFATECARVGVPRIDRGFGEVAVGPAVFTHGTDEQRNRLLPGIISGADRYCRGYAEAEHGSDLASVRTSGVVAGTDIVLNGRKTWVRDADRANMICVLCRTDAAEQGERGTSFVLVPMTADNGVERVPIRTLTGSAGMYEVVLTDTRASLTDVIGGLGHGWQPVRTAFRHQREHVPSVAWLGFEAQFWELVHEVRKAGRAGEPAVRDQLAWVYGRVTQLRLSAMRLAEGVAAGAQPGPLAAIEPLARGEFRRRFAEIAVGLTGMAGLVGEPGDGGAARWRRMLLASRADTIDPETSEILRSTIAERALGLPGGDSPGVAGGTSGTREFTSWTRTDR
jgi:alkylation response protein AidB-like acyl-CoA dehydrogenase